MINFKRNRSLTPVMAAIIIGLLFGCSGKKPGPGGAEATKVLLASFTASPLVKAPYRDLAYMVPTNMEAYYSVQMYPVMTAGMRFFSAIGVPIVKGMWTDFKSGKLMEQWKRDDQGSKAPTDSEAALADVAPDEIIMEETAPDEAAATEDALAEAVPGEEAALPEEVPAEDALADAVPADEATPDEAELAEEVPAESMPEITLDDQAPQAPKAPPAPPTALLDLAKWPTGRIGMAKRTEIIDKEQEVGQKFKKNEVLLLIGSRNYTAAENSLPILVTMGGPQIAQGMSMIGGAVEVFGEPEPIPPLEYKARKIYCRALDPDNTAVICGVAVADAVAFAMVPDEDWTNETPKSLEYSQNLLKKVIDLEAADGKGSFGDTEFYRTCRKNTPENAIVSIVLPSPAKVAAQPAAPETGSAPQEPQPADDAQALSPEAGEPAPVPTEEPPSAPQPPSKLAEEFDAFHGMHIVFSVEDISPRVRINIVADPSKIESSVYLKKLLSIASSQHAIVQTLSTDQSLTILTMGPLKDILNFVISLNSDPGYVGTEGVSKFDKAKADIAETTGMAFDDIIGLVGNEMGIVLMGIPNQKSLEKMDLGSMGSDMSFDKMKTPIAEMSLVLAIEATDTAKAAELVAQMLETKAGWKVENVGDYWKLIPQSKPKAAQPAPEDETMEASETAPGDEPPAEAAAPAPAPPTEVVFFMAVKDKYLLFASQESGLQTILSTQPGKPEALTGPVQLQVPLGRIIEAGVTNDFVADTLKPENVNEVKKYIGDIKNMVGNLNAGVELSQNGIAITVDLQLNRPAIAAYPWWDVLTQKAEQL